MYKYDVSKTHCSPSIDEKGNLKLVIQQSHYRKLLVN